LFISNKGSGSYFSLTKEGGGCTSQHRKGKLFFTNKESGFCLSPRTKEMGLYYNLSIMEEKAEEEGYVYVVTEYMNIRQL
jgi:hypothetical protein